MMRSIALLALLCALAAPALAGGPEFLPEGQVLFAVPAADITKPRFEVSWQRWRLDGETINAGRANLGSELSILRWSREGEARFDLGLDAGVLAVFNLDGKTQDLLNADYSIGLPFAWRVDERWSARLRIYHASSHLGDEFVLFDGQPFEVDERLELSFEAVDALAAYRVESLRLYAGATRIVSSATSIDRNRIQAGAEYEIELGRPTLTLALDLQAWEETDWEVQTALRASARITSPSRPTRSIALFLEAYDGPLPYGQFYVFDVSWVGLGLRFRL